MEARSNCNVAIILKKMNMKTKLLILVAMFLMVGICSFGQLLRPPVNTDKLELTGNFIWQGDYVWKDTINYIWQISPTCYKLKHIGTTVWSGPFCFDKAGDDSIQSEWDSLWIKPGGIIKTPKTSISVIVNGNTIILIDGGTFTRNDSVFYVRKDPFCSICWQYSYGNTNDWKLLYCENVSTGQFTIAKKLKDLFYMTYGQDIFNWVDSLHPIINLADSGKVLMSMPDSTWQWQPLPKDSLFNKSNKKWLLPGDSIPNQLDSFNVNGVWKKNGAVSSVLDSILDKSRSKWITYKNDTIFDQHDSTYFKPENVWKGNKDTVDIFWKKHTNGIYFQPTGNKAVGLNSYPGIQNSILNIETSGSVFSSGIYVNASTTGIESTGSSWAGKFHGKLKTDQFYIDNMRYPATIGSYGQYLGVLNDSTLWWFPPSKDTITINGNHLTNGSSITINPSQWGNDIVGIHYYAGYGSVGIGCNSSWLYGLSVLHDSTGMGTAAIAIKAESPGATAIQGETDSYIGIRGIANTTGYSGLFSGGKGLWTDGLTVFSKDGIHPKLYSLPEEDGDSTNVLTTNGKGDLKFLPIISKDSFYVDLYYNDGWKHPGDTLTVSFYDLQNIDPEMIPDSGQVLQYNGYNWTSGAILGTMATYNFWFGTQAEWTANTPHDGIYPQSSTTIWHVKD